MSESTQPPDELDALLGGTLQFGSVGDESHALRDALRGQSTAAFVRRRRRRRAVRIAGMAACYLLGVVTIYAWQQVSAMPADRTAESYAGTNVVEPAGKSSSEAAPDAARTSIAAKEEERGAIDRGDASVEEKGMALAPRKKTVKKSRFDSLRELGDYHLLADRNPEQALRCYRVALRYATDEEFTAASQDGTWLLRVICLDAKQENEHASKS